MDSGDAGADERDSIALIEANKSDNALNLARFLLVTAPPFRDNAR